MDGPVNAPGRLGWQGLSWGDLWGPLAGDSALSVGTDTGGDGVAWEAGCSAGLLSGGLVAGAGTLV